MATTTTTTAPPVRNPKDSMKSTWRRDQSQWTIHHRLYELFGIHPSYLDKEPPVHEKEDKVPNVQNWQYQRWVLVHASIPLIIHQLYAWYFGQNLGRIAAFIFYTVAYHAIAIHELIILRRLGVKYGFLDGDKHVRDEVPDVRVRQVIQSLTGTATFRPLIAVILSYNVNQTPLSLDWISLPIALCTYGVVLDFWFYWYHRVMHQFDGLWKFHRTHHLTKHPNPLLTLYADTEQEILDIAGIPLLTYFTLKAFGLPMGFYEWWYCHQFIVFAELLGHSGLRVHGSAPNPTTWLLQYFDVDLVIEDHDLHHRTGWKKSHNYGKQTRVWDRVFGTCAPRIESIDKNVDYDNPAPMPLW